MLNEIVAKEKVVIEAIERVEKNIQTMIYTTSNELKSILIHGVSNKNKEKNRKARAAIVKIKNELVAIQPIDFISVNSEIRKIDKESRKKMINFKKKYNRMFDKYHKELKEILFELDKKIGSK